MIGKDAPLMMVIEATPNEIIAMNAVITHYLKHYQLDRDMSTLLQQFQRRLAERAGLPVSLFKDTTPVTSIKMEERR